MTIRPYDANLMGSDLYLNWDKIFSAIALIIQESLCLPKFLSE